MKFISRPLAAAAVLALGATCFAAGPTTAQAAGTPVRITPNPGYAAAPFEGWGTSLVWFANATGGYPEEVRQDLFDKVFGEDGLNLNIARYNVGGGNATDVPPYLRAGGAVEGWWNPDLGVSDDQGPITSTYADRHRYAAAWDGDDPDHYDFDADATQRWWLDALADKITKWEAFSNSPPYFLTQSGYVSGGINNATSEQLPIENMEAFADYLVTVVEHLEDTHGIEFDTIDPFNEPNTNYWSTQIGSNGWPTSASRQEGAHIGPARQDLMIKALDARLNETGVSTDAVISAMDETNPGTFVTNWNGWSQESKNAVAQLNVHTYGTGSRPVVRDIAKASDKPLWMSEIEGNWDTSGAGFNLTNIDNGLGMAQRVADDLRELEPTAWVLWQPVEDTYNMEKVEKLNWGSVFIDFDCNAEGDSLRRIADGDADPSCTVLTNAKFNTLRNYTHYIRPGDSLIPTDNTQTTAALQADGDGVTLVHINSETTARELTVDLSRFGEVAPGATVTPVVTTASPASDVTANALVVGDAVPVDVESETAVISVPAKSVTTLLVDGVTGVADDAPHLADGETYQLVGVQSGKALTADPSGLSIRAGGTTEATARPQAWTVHTLSGQGSDRQRIVLENGDGRLLGVSGTSTVLVDAALEDAASTPSLQWIASTADGKTFSLLSVTAERVLDVDGQSSAEGTAVGTWTSNLGSNQRWTIASVDVREVRPVEAATSVGVAPQLPDQVTLVYAGGVERVASVAWDLSGQTWGAAGTVTVTGQGTDVFGTPFTAQATVVVGSFTSTDPVAMRTFAGAGLARVQALAPTTVPGRVGDAPQRFPLEVTWDWSGLTDASFASTGKVRVTGTATGGGVQVPAELTVTVAVADEANVAPASTPSATYTESGYPVDRTINRARTDKGWSNWRSGTKNAQDTLTYRLANQENVRHVTAYFYKDGASNSWPETMRVEYRVGSGDWIATDLIPVPVPVDGQAPVVDVELGGVEATEVRVVMNARSQTHLIVSEVEIYAAVPSDGPVEALDLAPTATTRCVAGKVVVALTVKGDAAHGVTVAASGTYGTANLGPIAAGASASKAFSSREASVPAGEISVIGTAVDDSSLTQTLNAAYPATTCS